MKHRHRKLDFLEARLAEVSYGSEADTTLTTKRRSAIVLLPTVTWLTGPATWKRSAFGLLPHHLRWSCQHRCIALEPGSHRLNWISTSFGRRLHGVVHINVNGERIANQPVTVDDETLHRNNCTVTTGVAAPRTIARQRRQLVDAGAAARWQLLSHLTPFVQERVRRAGLAVGLELGLDDTILDHIDLDAIVDTLVLGNDDTTTSTLNRRIDRYAAAKTRPAAEFYRYLRTTIDRDAQLAIRRRIDDPRYVGKALRRFRASHPDLDLDELLTAFNRTQPRRDQVSYDRAWRSLVPSLPDGPPKPSCGVLEVSEALDRVEHIA